MKLTTLFAFLSCCCAYGQDKAAASHAEAAACGSTETRFEVKADASQHPTPAPPDGKAMIYVVGEVARERIGIDGKWAGATNRQTYFYAAVDPGEHHLCALLSFTLGNWVSLHSLEAKAGETYYFSPMAIDSGGKGGRYVLQQLDPDEGKYLVAKAKFVSQSK